MELKDLKSIIDMLKESDITDLQVESEGYKVRLKREKIVTSMELPRVSHSIPPAEAAPQPQSRQQKADEQDTQGLVTVTAPLVGTFYRSATPDAEPFVEVGDRVSKGQVICIVEAMKLMNEIESEVSGVIVKCLVENAQPVEYGEPLFLVEP
jgi:acetyl-CoA carboxylase biotin carboxyl carrier protein